MDINVKEERPWGYFINLSKGEGYLTKVIHVNTGQKLSVQMHNHRSEHWFVACGTARVLLDGRDFVLSKGESLDIPVKTVHSLQNPYDKPLEVIEVQQGDILSEDDIVRYEDIYGRV